MFETKKYAIGNMPKEYDLVMKYLGWFPKGLNSWETIIENGASEVVLVRPNQEGQVELLLYRQISKDAFPMEFHGDGRSIGHHRFCIVSEKINPKEYLIIPMH